MFYNSFFTSCKLNSYLHNIDVRATEMYDRIVNQLKEKQGTTEQLKAADKRISESTKGEKLWINEECSG